MQREIVTAELDNGQLRVELRNVIEYFSARGIETCSVLFGWAWGMKYYADNSWPTESIRLADLEAMVQAVEASGIGELGADDLWLTIDELEFLFCHESNIHIRFETASPIATIFFDRWKQCDFEPKERDV